MSFKGQKYRPHEPVHRPRIKNRFGKPALNPQEPGSELTDRHSRYSLEAARPELNLEAAEKIFCISPKTVLADWEASTLWCRPRFL